MERRFGITGNELKIIALVAMAIDHMGAVVVAYFMSLPGEYSDFWGSLYRPCRSIGRIAFPIFCFLLVEGFLHTKNKAKYFLRILLFALLSEIPFNLAFQGKLKAPMYQNVFWELAMGIFLMMLLAEIEKRSRNLILKVSLMILMVMVTAGAAESLCFDYGEHGIITIALLYYFRNSRSLQLMAGAFSFLWSWKAMLGFLPIIFYNGKKGRGIKYAFYIFYPAHLLVFYLIIRVAACINP